MKKMKNTMKSTIGLLAVTTALVVGGPRLLRAAQPGQTEYTFTTLAGAAGQAGSTDGTGNAARFNHPWAVAVDELGEVYVSDTYNHTVRKIGPGGVVTTIAGTPGQAGSTDGPWRTGQFMFPSGIAVDNAGSVYVAERDNHTVRRIQVGGVVTTVAGLAGQPGSTNGTGSAARFHTPTGLALDRAENLYLAEFDNHTIRQIVTGGVVTTLAGLAGQEGSSNGTGSAARFAGPQGVAVDRDGKVFVADFGNHTIRKIGVGGVVTTVAGRAGEGGSTDGTLGTARFSFPRGIAVDGASNLYVADNQMIRKINLLAGSVKTVAGLAGQTGSTNGTGSTARFNVPCGLAVDQAGNLFVADYGNHTIRVGFKDPAARISVPPRSCTNTMGSTATFAVVAYGKPPLSFRWRKGAVPLVNTGRITGVTTPTLTITNVQTSDAGVYSVVVTNAVGASTSPDATLTVEMPEALLEWRGAWSTDNVVDFRVAGAKVFVGSYSFTPMGSDGRLDVVDFTQPAEPVKLGQLWVANGIDGIWLQGDVAYLRVMHYSTRAQTYSGVAVDVRNPTNMIYLGSSSLEGRVLAVSADRIYGRIGESHWPWGGWYALAVWDRHSLGYLGRYNKSPSGVAVMTNCVLAAFGDLETLDFSDPAQPRRIGGLTTTAYGDVEAAGRYAYVAAAESGLLTIDVVDPASPKVVHVFDTPGSAQSLEMVGDYLCLTDGFGGVFVFSVRPPEPPVVVARYEDGQFWRLLCAEGDDLYALSNNSGGGDVRIQALRLYHGAKPEEPPAFVTQPRGCTNAVGTTATLTVQVSGSPPPSLQWFKDSGALADEGRISGVLTSMLSIGNIQTSDAGWYGVVISNAVGCVTSQVARVVVGYPLTVSTQGLGTVQVNPPLGVFEPGQSVQLTAVASEGSTFVGWSGDASGTENTITLVMDRAKTVQAQFWTPPRATPPGLVAWWTGDGEATDLYGTNHGKLWNGATYTAGMVGQAFWFDGADDRFEATTGGLPVGTTDRTIEFWARMDAVPPSGTEACFAGYGSYGSYGSVFHLGTLGGNNALFWSSWNPGFAGPTLQTGRWYHIAVTGQAGVLRLYLDGVMVGSQSLPFQTPSGKLFYVGAIPDSLGLWGVRRLRGAVDEVSVYSRALSSDELLGIYRAGSAGKTKTLSPLITEQPLGVRVAVGMPYSLRVTATGTAPLSYQWRRDGLPLPQMVSNLVQVLQAQLADAGNYQVVVTNSLGSATSQVARVVVGYPLTVTTNGVGTVQVDPAFEIFEAGQTVQLTAVPAPGRTFLGWSGDASGTGNPVQLTMDAPKRVEAAFWMTGFGFSISETGGDAGRSAIIEPEQDGIPPEGCLFGEDAWVFSDRNHEVNGGALDEAGNLVLTAATQPARIVGLPAYLIGRPYIANANDHKDNPGYQLLIALPAGARLYLLLDNRLGDSNAADPPVLGDANGGLMSWVAALGFRPVNTGLSPKGYPDFVGVDEAVGYGAVTSPNARIHAYSALGQGAGVSIDNYYSVYALDAPAGTITLGAQNDGSTRNMYGVVVEAFATPRIEKQPSVAVWKEGNEGRITIEASGTPTPQLQWFCNGTAVPGATNATLVLPAVTRALEGTYWLVASNALGQATSAPIVAVVSNVDPERFVALAWAGRASGLTLESTDLLRPGAAWQTLSNYPPATTEQRFVELKPAPAVFYRLSASEPGPVPSPMFTGAGFVNGWWHTNTTGTKRLIEYVAASTAWTNWQVLTNLTLPASPYLFLDHDGLGQPARVYRTTVVP